MNVEMHIKYLTDAEIWIMEEVINSEKNQYHLLDLGNWRRAYTQQFL